MHNIPKGLKLGSTSDTLIQDIHSLFWASLSPMSIISYFEIKLRHLKKFWTTPLLLPPHGRKLLKTLWEKEKRTGRSHLSRFGQDWHSKESIPSKLSFDPPQHQMPSSGLKRSPGTEWNDWDVRLRIYGLKLNFMLKIAVMSPCCPPWPPEYRQRSTVVKNRNQKLQQYI